MNFFPLPGRVFPFPEPLVVHGVASCHDDGVTRVDSQTEESDEKMSVAYKPHFGLAPVCLFMTSAFATHSKTSFDVLCRKKMVQVGIRRQERREQ